MSVPRRSENRKRVGGTNFGNRLDRAFSRLYCSNTIHETGKDAVHDDRITHPSQRILEFNLRDALNAVLSDHYARTNRTLVPASVEVLLEKRQGLFGGRDANYVGDIHVELVEGE